MKARIQFEMSEKMGDELEYLMEEFGISTKKDLFNNSISLLKWVHGELEKGRNVGSINPLNSAYTELQMPIFSNVEKTEGRDAA